MVNRRRIYARTRRRVEDMLLDYLANPVEEDWSRLRDSFPELNEMGIGFKTVVQRPMPADPCVVFVESFSSVRHAVPDEIAVYVMSSVDEGELGIRDLYLSRLPEV